MSTAAQPIPAPAPVRTRRCEAWCDRPACYADGTEFPPNAHKPLYSWKVQHAMIVSDQIVIRAIQTLAYVQVPHGRVHQGASINGVAAATAKFTPDGRAMARQTVADSLKRMHERRIAVRFDIDSGAPRSSGRRGDAFPHSAILLPEYSWTLDQWFRDAEIATATGGGHRAFYTIGKGHRHCTPEEAKLWNVNADRARENPAAWPPGEGPEPEPAADPRPAPQPKPLPASVASSQPTAAKPRETHETREERRIEHLVEAFEIRHGRGPYDAAIRSDAQRRLLNAPPHLREIAHERWRVRREGQDGEGTG
jgi:hypothetical protein